LQLDDTGLPSGRQQMLQSDRVRVPRLVNDLGAAKRLQDDTKAKIALVELHDVLVVKNANLLPADSAKRTMSDGDLKSVLDKLRPLALEDSQPKLVLSSQLKNITIEDFQKYFVPSPKTPTSGEKATPGTGGGGAKP
jgi:hypothetical protein